MIPFIYKLRYRGQFVNDACQYIVEHIRLALNTCIIPMLFLVLLEIINLLFIQSFLITVGVAFLALVLTYVLPSIFMYITEHPVEYGYPDRMPKLLEARDLFLPYTVKAVIIIVIGGILTMLSIFVIIGPLIIPFVAILALVKYQRCNEYVSFAEDEVYTDDSLSISDIFSMVIDNFGNFMLLALGSYIIIVSMMFGPSLMIFLLFEFIDAFVSTEFCKLIYTYLGADFIENIYMMFRVIGAVFSNMIILVITHFFYGHCQTTLAV